MSLQDRLDIAAKRRLAHDRVMQHDAQRIQVHRRHHLARSGNHLGRDKLGRSDELLANAGQWRLSNDPSDAKVEHLHPVGLTMKRRE